MLVFFFSVMGDLYRQKILIHNILRLQDELYLAGGTYAYSKQNRRLNKKIRLLLEKSGLEYSKENIIHVFSYPFDPPSFDIKDNCDVSICAKKECRVRHQFLDEFTCHTLVMPYKPWDVRMRVMNVELNLIGLKDEGDGLW